jgi:hypothetical protein
MMTDSQFRDFYFGRLKWCGCGDPTDPLRELLASLQAVRDRGDDLPKIDHFRIYALDSYGLTEHGVSVRYAWLSEDGKAVLGYLESNLGRVEDVLDSDAVEA